MSLSQYKIIKQIGSGTQASIFSSIRKSDKKKCVIRLDPFPKNPATDTELQILQLLKSSKPHPHLISITEVFYDSGLWCVVMERQFTDLLKFMSYNGHITRRQTLTYGLQIASALELLHRLQISHGDIKLENVLISKDGRSAILTDFGLSSFIQNHQNNCEEKKKRRRGTHPRGSPRYVAPEQFIFLKNSNTLSSTKEEFHFFDGKKEENEEEFAEYEASKGDIYSFGVLLFILLSASFPFEDQNGEDYYSVMVDTISMRKRQHRKDLEKWNGIILKTRREKEFFQGILSLRAADRPTAGQLLRVSSCSKTSFLRSLIDKRMNRQLSLWDTFKE